LQQALVKGGNPSLLLLRLLLLLGLLLPVMVMMMVVATAMNSLCSSSDSFRSPQHCAVLLRVQMLRYKRQVQRESPLYLQ
jgi:hypothetical protein